MEYIKPTLTIAGTAQALVLGSKIGDGDNLQPTEEDTRAVLLHLGLDD
jgi:hypothetical protein